MEKTEATYRFYIKTQLPEKVRRHLLVACWAWVQRDDSEAFEFGPCPTPEEVNKYHKSCGYYGENG